MPDKFNIDDQFTERAWGEMSKVLDKELPVKKKNRTIFFFLFGAAALLLLGVLYFANVEEEVKYQRPTIQKQLTEKNEGAKSNNTAQNKIIDVIKIEAKEKVNTLALDKDTKDSFESTPNTKLVEHQNNQSAGSLEEEITTIKAKLNHEAIVSNELHKVISQINVPKIISQNKNIDAKNIEEKEEVLTDAVSLDENKKEVQKDPIVMLEEKQEKAETKILEKEEIAKEEITKTKENLLAEEKLNAATENLLNDESKVEEVAAEEEKIKVKANKWTLGLRTNIFVNPEFNNIEDWTVGTLLTFDLGKKFKIGTGPAYTYSVSKLDNNDKGDQIFGAQTGDDNMEMDTTDTSTPSTSGSGDPDGNQGGFTPGLSVIKNQLKVHYLDLPLFLQFNLNKRIGLELGGGTMIKLSSDQTEELKNLVLYTKAGFNFNINKHLSLSAQYKFTSTRFKNQNNFDNRNLDAYEQSLRVTLPSKHAFGLGLRYRF